MEEIIDTIMNGTIVREDLPILVRKFDIGMKK